MQLIDFTSRYAFKVLHTPGHTMESVVYLLVDKADDNKPLKVYNMTIYNMSIYSGHAYLQSDKLTLTLAPRPLSVF